MKLRPLTLLRLRRCCLPFFVLAPLVFARGLAGQVGGVVIDPEGRGVAEVTLTLWRAGQEIARVSSDSIGRFRFTVAQAERATALVARRLGLRPATTSVTPEATDLRLQMEPIPLPLPLGGPA